MKSESSSNSTAFYIRLSLLTLLLVGAIWARYTKYPPVVRAVNALFGNGTKETALAPLTQEQLQNESNAAKSLEGMGITIVYSEKSKAPVAANFKEKSMEDEMAQYLANLLRLQGAFLANTGTTNVQAEVLGPLVELRAINLANCPISDGAFATWSKFPFLHTFYLSGTSVTSAGVADILAKCPQLKDLGLDRCAKVDDQAVEAIINAKSLRTVNCSDSGISPEGQRQINDAMAKRQ